MDTLTGTTGNDTFIADNSSTTARTVSAADSINGGLGNDTLKYYANSADTSITLPQLTSVETLYVNGGAAITANVSATGVTSVQIDNLGGAATYTLNGATQSLTVMNDNGSAVYNVTAKYGATDASANITLDGVGTSGSAATLDVQGTVLATLNLNSTGAANNVDLTNSVGGKLATVNVSGDKALTLVEGMNSVTAINASSDTGGVTADVTTVAALDKSFAFTGGSGNDTLKLAAGQLALLTSGAQLDGGAGSNTLEIAETSITSAFAGLKALNATANFQTLEFNGAGATVDQSAITNSTITTEKFAVGANAVTVNNAVGSEHYSIVSATTATFNAKLGETTLNVSLDGSSTTAASATGISLSNATTLNLASNGSLATGTFATDANQAGTVTLKDNSVLNISGSQALKLTVADAAYTVGETVNASAFTGKLEITGIAGVDHITVGSGGSTVHMTDGNDVITLGAGKDVVSFDSGSTLILGATDFTQVNGFTTGQDTVQLASTQFAGGLATAGQETAIQGAVNLLASTATLSDAITAVTGNAGFVKGEVYSFQFQGNTFIYANDNGATNHIALVELVGISSVHTGDITLA